MIRFHCPLCDKTLKAPEGKAGATVICPRCKERSVVPLAGDGSDGPPPGSGVLGRGAAHAYGDEAPPLFPACGLLTSAEDNTPTNNRLCMSLLSVSIIMPKEFAEQEMCDGVRLI